MRNFGFFLFGSTVGLIACFIFIYLAGILFESLGVQLYDSKADQQRNFNIFFVASTIVSVIAGLLFAKKFA